MGRRIGTRDAGLTLRPGGVRAADALGYATRPDEVRLVMNTTGTVLAEEPVEVGAPGAPRLHLLGSALRRAVLDECLTAAAVVLLATVVEDYTANGDGVTVRIASPPGVWPAKGCRPARMDLAAALTGWRPPMVGLVGNADPHGLVMVGLVGNADPHGLVVADVRDRAPAPCWAEGRVTLLGDVAHPRSRISARSSYSPTPWSRTTTRPPPPPPARTNA